MTTQKFSVLPRQVAGGPVTSDNVLRSASEAALSATGSTTGIPNPVIEGMYFKVRINHSAITGVDGSNYWTLTVEVSDVVGGTYTTVSKSLTLGATAATIDVPLFGPDIERLDADADYIRITATKTGTPGNLTYNAVVNEFD